MGLLSGLFGKKPSQQAPGPDERAQAVSAARDMRRLETTFFPLQEQAALDAGKDFTNLYAGRSSADSAIAGKQALAPSMLDGVATGNMSRYSRLSNSVAATRGEGQVGAKGSALNLQDRRRLGIAGLGHGLAADTGKGFHSAANAEASMTMSKLNADTQISNSRLAAVGEAAGTAAMMYAMRPAPTGVPKKITSTAQSKIVAPNSGVDMYRANYYEGHA